MPEFIDPLAKQNRKGRRSVTVFGSVCRTSLSNQALCFLLHENSNKLNRAHKYFYQIQGQLAIVERDYCEFIIMDL